MNDLAIVAGAMGAGFGAMKPMAEAAADLAKKLLGRPLLVAGDLLADEVYRIQCENRIRTLHKLKLKLEETGTPPEAMPPGFLVAAMEAIGNVDDEDLQHLWANLLKSAMTDPDKRSPMYLGVLRQLGTREAVWFSKSYEALLSNDLDISTLNTDAVYQLLALGLVKHPHPEFWLEVFHTDPGDSNFGSEPVKYFVRQQPEQPEMCVTISEFGQLFAEAVKIQEIA
ncbi:MAG: DUF2806 domain-containing protein [Phycisphaerales bacterium JB060]